MLTLTPAVRIFVCMEPTDMRKSFDGLHGLVVDILEKDPQSGHIFVFFNRRRDRVKLMWWDRTGFWIAYKRLEAGTFSTRGIDRSQSTCNEILGGELDLLLEGIDLSQAQRRRRFEDQRQRPASMTG